ncbi:hypothetical protein [Parabacteroides sp. FAFU027]|uniref:hypothetical protein n=1 Tax=Parabacteroides sp. FAFU027 TaxID=2922715 RepID=UPI001FAF17D3|nr:hypothetical protein [Parabacteroides sp. FAFU027]
MNKLLLHIFLPLIVILVSCKKEKPITDYTYELFPAPKDTSLYISYEMNNKYYKYYQVIDYRNSYINLLTCPNNRVLGYFERGVSYDRLITDPDYFNVLHPAFSFIFWNTRMQDKNSQSFDDYYYKTRLSDDLKKYTSYTFSYPPESPSVKDTIPTHGMNIGSYTDNVNNAFNHNKTLIDNFFARNSHFNISKIELVNNKYYLVSGDFTTKTIQGNDTIDIKNGKFTFITK